MTKNDILAPKWQFSPEKIALRLLTIFSFYDGFQPTRCGRFTRGRKLGHPLRHFKSFRFSDFLFLILFLKYFFQVFLCVLETFLIDTENNSRHFVDFKNFASRISKRMNIDHSFYQFRDYSAETWHIACGT